MSEGRSIASVICNNCGGGFRNHEIIQSHIESWRDPEGMSFGSETYEIIKCLGCDTVRFRTFSTSDDRYDPNSEEMIPHDFRIFPDSPPDERRPEDYELFPDDVAKMYLETIKCLNSGANTLAGGGLRAIVEAICKDKAISKKNLKDKIDELVTQGFLAKNQADLLHEERYLGNSALHEMKTPTKRDLDDGLKIVEGLMNTIYVLPIHAERLKKKRIPKSATSITKFTKAPSPPKANDSTESKKADPTKT
jgi:hypothetical protein